MILLNHFIFLHLVILFYIKELLVFFSSSALSSIAPGINCLIENGGKVEIIASPKLSKEDIEEIKKGYQIREIIENSILREMENVPEDIDLKNLSYLASLVADNKLDIKIASLSRNNGISMYHEKFGIITDEKGNSVAFSGSMNESENAFLGNYESFDVFCSWTSDYDRVCDKKWLLTLYGMIMSQGYKQFRFQKLQKRDYFSITQE